MYSPVWRTDATDATDTHTNTPIYISMYSEEKICEMERVGFSNDNGFLGTPWCGS